MVKIRGLTLTEILVVVAIIALVAALLFPVFTSARRKSKEVPCTSNLRQFQMAVAMYMAGNNDVMPAKIDELLDASTGLSSIIQCPADGTTGANIFATERLSRKISYFYIRNHPGFRSAIEQADPNHGIAYCVVHGQHLETLGDFVPDRDTTGLVLRLRRDGSVQRAHVGRWCSAITKNGRLEGRQHWSLLSDIKCVEPYCDGLTEPCQ